MVMKRRRHSAAYKFRIALEALEGSKTISQLSSEHEIHPNMIRAWKRQLLEDGPSVFASNGERKQRQQEAQEAELYEQMAAARPLRIGRLKMELEWLKKKLPALVRERRRMVDVARPDPECTAPVQTARAQVPPSTIRRLPSQRLNLADAAD